jgi:hypothetical protein
MVVADMPFELWKRRSHQIVHWRNSARVWKCCGYWIWAQPIFEAWQLRLPSTWSATLVSNLNVSSQPLNRPTFPMISSNVLSWSATRANSTGSDRWFGRGRLDSTIFPSQATLLDSFSPLPVRRHPDKGIWAIARLHTFTCFQRLDALTQI